MSVTAKKARSAAAKSKPILKERRKGSRKVPGFGNRKNEPRVDGLTKQEIVAEYTNQVKLIAHKIANRVPKNIEVDDLVSVGYIGLMDAADKFDPSRGYKFKTYAEFRIRGAILDELRSQDWVPRNVREKHDKIETTRARLERELGRAPSDLEISDELGMSNDDFQKLRGQVGSMSLVTYDDISHLSQQDQWLVHSRAGSEEAMQTPFDQMSKQDAHNNISDLLGELSENEQQVVKFYYFRGLSLKQISQIMELTESRISQIHVKAISHLKTELTRKGIDSKKLFLMLFSN